MKSLKKITVITVTYNAEKYLESTIKSVVEQSYPNIEYIIIDGNSTDGTIEIIKKYEKYLAYWVSEKDKGIYDAMNKGIEKATGDFINFMNAGDSFVSSKIVEQVVDSLNSNINLIYGGVNGYFEDNHEIIYAPPSAIEDIKHRHPYNHQSCFLKIDFAKKYRFDTRYEYAADVNQFFEIYTNEVICEKMIDQPLTNYLMGGYWQQNHLSAHFEILDILRRYFKSITDIYLHSSFQVIQNNNPNINFLFSQMYNKLIDQIKNIEIQYEKIVLYGYGNIGKLIEGLLKRKVIYRFDKIHDDINVFSPKTIKSIEYDIVLITVLGREEEIKNYLTYKLQVPTTKIVTLNLC